jgi:hypothetical protein
LPSVGARDAALGVGDTLQGLLPEAPGLFWLTAVRAHIAFVRSHPWRVERLAMMTVDALRAMLPRIAGVPLQRAVRQHRNAALSVALAWLHAG